MNRSEAPGCLRHWAWPPQRYRSTVLLAQDADDHIIYETDTGKLFYDADATGANAGVHFATLTAELSLTNADFSVLWGNPYAYSRPR